MQTDWWVRVPALRLADAHANATSGTYMYEFAWPSPGLGAVHALEIAFVFDTLSKDVPLLGPLLGEDPPQELADTMHAAWVSFATSGDPGWPGVRPGPQGHHALRHHLAGGGRPPTPGSGPCGKASASSPIRS